MDTSAQAPATAIGQSVGIRAGATIIDIVIFWAFSFIVAIATGETSGAGFALGTLGSCLVGIIGIAYYVVMETMYGGTVGKLALGLKVVKEDGSAPDWQTSIIRTLLRIVDGLFFYLIGAILVWTSPTNQRLGDKLAKTLVVKKDQVVGPSASPTARF
jgi:uncharacterized RDD family membrane protein YckC